MPSSLMMVKRPSRDDLYFNALAVPACNRLFTTLFGTELAGFYGDEGKVHTYMDT